MKMLVKERRACWVDFYHEVDIEGDVDEDTLEGRAFDAVGNGDSKYLGCSVQDSIEFCDSEHDIVDSVPRCIDRS